MLRAVQQRLEQLDVWHRAQNTELEPASQRSAVEEFLKGARDADAGVLAAMTEELLLEITHAHHRSPDQALKKTTAVRRPLRPFWRPFCLRVLPA